MTRSSWLSWTFSPSHVRRATRRNPATTAHKRRHRFRPSSETLETRVTPSYSLSTLASFDGANGTGDRGLIMDSSGNLYGPTALGGANGDGTVFENAKGSGMISTLASFDGSNGDNPEFGLVMDSSGNLYGATGDGGANGDGTVFEIAKGSGTITTLASFNGSNGNLPVGDLIMDSSGNLYGATAWGGANTSPSFPHGAGTVFEIAKGSTTITSLASFNGSNGFRPSRGLIMESSGSLYGTATDGGASSEGTVFELAHGSNTITTLASFNGTNGAFPECALIIDSSGNLYGTTADGGASGHGTVFDLAQGSGTISTLASFNVTNGDHPTDGVVMDSSGNLYGTALFGGASGDGTVFEVANGSDTITTLASFNGSNGEGPAGGLIMDKSGNLYGTTGTGGANGDGTVFELTNGPSFAITGPSGVTAGTAGSFTLTALNADGTFDASYSGTVQVTSSDPEAILPGNLAISGGTGTFNVTLETAGPQSVTATDVNNPSLTGFDTGVAVSPAAASQVVFTQTPSSGIAGQTLGSVGAAIEDAYGNVETGDNSDKVTLSVNTGPSTQMGGTLTETVEAGVVLFSNLLLDTSGSYTLAGVANLAGGGALGPVVSSGIAVASPVSLSFGSITYNTKTKLYSETVTLTNNTSGTLTGPMSLELTNLPGGVVLTDATGTTNGNPYVRFLNSGKTLKKSASVSITLTFTAPSQSDITFGTEVVVGL
jgi:uncharacterized repeat protein (TIGR03803 family)